MATLPFAYNHSRDPMNPDDLGDKIATNLSLTSLPDVQINPTQIIVSHPSITTANTAAIQSLINAYVLDPVRASLPAGNLGTLLAKAKNALAGNATFLAIASPTAAQVATQTKALTRQVDALIKIVANDLADTSGT